jgi:hypothetical protein
LAEGLLKAAGFAVTVNAERPRKGTFAVSLSSGAAGGEDVTIVSFVGMDRPFKKLREADLAADINKGIAAFSK